MTLLNSLIPLHQPAEQGLRPAPVTNFGGELTNRHPEDPGLSGPQRFRQHPAGGRAPRCRHATPSARWRTGARWPGITRTTEGVNVAGS